MLRRSLAALALVAVTVAPTVAPSAAGAAEGFPDVIPLDDGYRPEGIANAGGTRFYVGSIPTGAVVIGDARTGEVDPLVPGATGRAAIGLEEAGGLLFVAGGATGNAFVYDASTGADVATLPLAVADGTPTFVNDVVVTDEAAFFTDSRRLVLYRVDRGTLEVSRVALSGIELLTGNNLNGIEASPDGSVLIAVQSNAGKLFAIDPGTGEAAEIVVEGATSFVNGDGLLLEGKTLYVVQNRANAIAVVELAPDLRSGVLAGTITSDDFEVPTTVARIGGRLYLPNAKFGIAEPDTAPYEVVAVER